MDLSGQPERRQPADDRGGRDEGVVGPQRLRCVAGLAVDPEAAPAAPLLTDHDGQAPAGRAVKGDAAGLGDEIVALHGVGLVLGQPAGAVRAECFLVGDGSQHERPLRPEAAASEAIKCHRHRRRDVQHVDGAPAPHLALHQLPAEGITRPRVRVGRNDIGVPEPAQRRCRRIGALDASHERRPSGDGLVDLEVHARAVELGPQEVDAPALVPGLRRPVVHALVSDHALDEIDDLELRHPWLPSGETIRHMAMWAVSKLWNSSPHSANPARA
jgi:hypothetical protein